MEENYAKYLENGSVFSLGCIDVVYGGEVTALFAGQPQRGDAEPRRRMLEAALRGKSQRESGQAGVGAGRGGETSV